MEFTTSLNNEQIRRRLSMYAKPMKRGAYLDEHQLLFRWIKDDTFELLKTGASISV